MEKTNLNRYDNIDNSEFMTIPFERTTEGFLKGRAIVTSVGVFTYKKADGTVQRELRLPEEVFSNATLESLKLKPVTLNHPNDMVTSENADRLQVGSLGDNPSSTTQKQMYDVWTPEDKLTDGYNCAIDMMITRQDAIDAVLNGKSSLSMGYTCDLEMAQPNSTWCGVEYDYIQRNIRYNHCAIVDAGRAGDNAKIILRKDSADAVLEEKIQIFDDGGKVMLKKINLDGIDYEAEESVIKALNSANSRADKAEKDAEEKETELDKLKADFEKMKKDFEGKISALEAEKDEAKEKAEKAKDECEKAKKDSADPARINELVKNRMNLVSTAEKAGVELKGDEADIDIKKSVVSKVFPKANLDGKDDVYINARFDGACEVLSDKMDAQNRQGMSDVPAQHNDSMDAREKMIQRMKNHGKED